MSHVHISFKRFVVNKIKFWFVASATWACILGAIFLVFCHKVVSSIDSVEIITLFFSVMNI